ncbi:DUF2279 domain-containing protein [Confluentibacter flavum]|uniref:DUF2279 domain-containing protein n=1 Tax=Confluentibacter flavum TaxID=1909700 RepID=A0A2N3HIP2_9FLAO|nr:DUF2279 domain-containing protein [Confluentibacter flavum]PKQ44850.1 DUF2279 domain-containing protein [Confluentibacter flavum]
MRCSKLKYILPLFFVAFFSFSQSKLDSFLTPSDTLNKPRRNAIVIGEASIIGVSLIGLNQLWYADYPKSKFHTIDDSEEWLQMDKIGHVFSSYQMGRMGAQGLNWSGVNKKDQLIYGATLGFGFLTAVEVFDGFSEEWGFSWTDVLANAVGTGLYVGQELLWEEQRMMLKFSFHQTQYASQRPDKLGDSFLEQVLKDYNGQTYWLNINLHSFFKQSNIPKWLDLSVGYGADGMLEGMKDVDNQLLTNNERVRQLYLSFDLNLSKIETKSRVLRSILDVFNVIKLPFPAIEFSKNGYVFHLLYY